jgi:hypothetical protein
MDNNTKLELSGNLSSEWDQYRRALQAAGVIITDKMDELIWIGGDTSGILTLKNVYEALLSTQDLPMITSWWIQMWKWNIQQK